MIAAGPYARRASRLVGADLPLHCELHVKIAWNDYVKLLNDWGDSGQVRLELPMQFVRHVTELDHPRHVVN